MKNDLQLLEINVMTEIEHEEHSASYSSQEASWAPIQTYHELADVPVKEIDIFEAIEANLAQLEDLQARMRFMVREVKYLLKA